MYVVFWWFGVLACRGRGLNVGVEGNKSILSNLQIKLFDKGEITDDDAWSCYVFLTIGNQKNGSPGTPLAWLLGEMNSFISQPL